MPAVLLRTEPVYGLGGSRRTPYDSMILATTGLVAYYPMDDAADATWLDIYGAHNGSYTASGWDHRVPSLLPTSSRFAVSAKAAGTHTASAGSAPTLTSYTVEEWVRIPSVANMSLFGLGGDNQGNWSVFSSHWYWWNGAGLDSLITPKANVPTHLVATNDGTTTRTYVNGVAGATAAGASTGSATWRIHAGLGGMPNGSILQACAVYGRALTAAEVLAHYRAGGV